MILMKVRESKDEDDSNKKNNSNNNNDNNNNYKNNNNNSNSNKELERERNEREEWQKIGSWFLRNTVCQKHFQQKQQSVWKVQLKLWDLKSLGKPK